MNWVNLTFPTILKSSLVAEKWEARGKDREDPETKPWKVEGKPPARVGANPDKIPPDTEGPEEREERRTPPR